MRLALDLREAYERGYRFGIHYGDLVDAWEIGNEPDIDFGPDNPETYAAFLKAAYLGLRDGAHARAKSYELGAKSPALRPNSSDWLARKQGWISGLGANSSQLTAHSSSHVVMAPLALPPGPYLERLWANGIASYTDGFNYHYYGFAEDFSGVYGQFEDAVRVLNAESTEFSESNLGSISARSATSVLKKKWPIFITEYGYGLLDADSRDTVEGRVRQWRWFAEVSEQIRSLRIAAPMAFYWNPYYEANLNEFGLMAEKPMELEAKSYELTANSSEPDARSSELATNSSQLTAPVFFTPADFGEKKPQDWMKRIGKQVGEWYASPALAYLWDYAERKPYRPRDWSVQVTPPSPVVIDFIAGDDMVQRKVSGGYVLNGRWVPAELLAAHPVDTKPKRTGLGRVMVYNFSSAPVSGRLEMTGSDGVWISSAGGQLTLAAGERRELSVELAVQAQTFTAGSYRVTFTPDQPEIGRAVWTTQLLPDATGMQSTVERGFDFSAEAAANNQRLLAARPLAAGEAGLKPAGRWLVTDGVRVEERDGVWRFHVDYLPEEALRPAAVELPLPEGFVFPEGAWLTMERRRGELRANSLELRAKSLELGANSPELKARIKSRAGRAGDVMDVYFRTENGNLYQTWPRVRVTGEWARYGGMAEDFTMGFFGRATLPWRFAENRPASLVFFLRPAQLPAVFEVRGAGIMRTAAP